MAWTDSSLQTSALLCEAGELVSYRRSINLKLDNDCGCHRRRIEKNQFFGSSNFQLRLEMHNYAKSIRKE